MRIKKLLNLSVKSIIFFSLLCISCSSQVDDRPKSAIPLKFSAYVGGFLGSSYSVELIGKSIKYEEISAGKTKKIMIEPTEQQWMKFRQTLDALKVWHWKNSYWDSQVMDGTQWGISIKYSDKKLDVVASNSYPDANGQPSKNAEFTPTFKAYLAAVSELVRGYDFD
jgi:hypothetical protein